MREYTVWTLILPFLLIVGCKNGPGGSIDTRVESASITGHIVADQTWSGEIHLTGDVWIDSGVTVTVEPGTTIRVAANSDDQHAGGSGIVDELTTDDPTTLDDYGKSHIGINVYGRLIAIGTPDAVIQLTSDAVSPSQTDWHGLWFREGSTGDLEYVTIEWVHTGPAAHGTDNVSVQHCTVWHTFWGALHAFQCSPIFEYNILDDIGHEAIDTHKASPIVRHNHISHARTGVVLNFHAGTPIIFENNTVRDCGAMMQLQENAWARILGNTFYGSSETGGPWTYGAFKLSSESPSSGVGLADNVNVDIVQNRFENIPRSPLFYERIGPNMGIGHTTNVPEPFEIGPGPVRIYVDQNAFVNCGDISTINPATGTHWQNFTVTESNTYE
ncbi:MAG: right-handed parallel beta-helix repeat-containing protein [Verrucomicrobiota bacterium]|nr:right-handed parallel beta-helix repeat-containing protein [Verrucomicrobiota bacterium]